MTLTLTDLFAGAGGSSTGAISIPGITVRCASNHWQLALDSHNTNHPDAQHICADLSQINPNYFPTTDLLWASPECTNHSIAKGRRRVDSQPDQKGEVLPDEAAERSRATMWDVPRFTEAHGYEAIIVENVVDAYNWIPFQAWLQAMDSLGYDHHIVFLNSMHAQAFGPGAPQSRDRMYVVFWRKGNRRPEIERLTSPAAVCGQCGPVRAVQRWKRADRQPWGRYRAQYVYACPRCDLTVEPDYRPAAEAIDWNLLGQRIGDRARPLADKTMARIQAGVEKYWGPILVPVEGRDGKNAASVDSPARTMTTRNETGVAVPFIAELRGGGSKHRPVTDPLCTVVANGNHHGLVTTYYGNGFTQPTSEPLATVTTVDRHGLLTGQTFDINDVLFRMLEPHEITAAMDFPDDYVILGNKRERVRQAGNAVTPPAARDLIGVVAQSLAVEVAA